MAVKKDNLIIPEVSAENKAMEFFPNDHQAKMVSAVDRAYVLADFTAHDPSSTGKWLSFGRGDFAVFSRIKQIAVEVELCRLIENGVLPYDYHFKFNPHNNHKYLIISEKDKFHMTVNQCKNNTHPAKKVEYREKENTNFQTRLILDEHDLEYDNNPTEEYLELNHGWQTVKPTFICLGIPEQATNNWAYSLNLARNINLLTSTDFKTTAGGPKPITPDEFAAYLKRESND